MHQLTSREAELLGAETATNLGHSGLLVFLEGPLSFQELRDQLAERVHLVPGFLRRLHTVPFDLDRPWWLEDGGFDLDYHLRYTGVPGSAPDQEQAFLDLVARIQERPIDRTRPLWEMYLIDRQGQPPALLVKMHHVLIDGVTGIDVLAPLVDSIKPEAERPPRRRDRVPNDRDLLIRAGWTMVSSPLRLAGLATRGLAAIPVIGRLNVLGPLAPWATPGGALELHSETPAPRVSFNRTIGAHRRVALASVPVDEVRMVHKAHGVRFNDVVLALVAGALRHWLVVHDELPLEPLVALTPLLVDTADEPLGTALVPLATNRHEAGLRLAEIAAEMKKLSIDVDAQPVDSIRSMYDAAPAIAALASRLMVRTGAFTRLLPPFNVYVVNVPGGAVSTVAGVGIAHQFSLSTLVDGAGLSISVMSTGDSLDFSFVADRDLVSDLGVMADQIVHELAVLGAAEPQAGSGSK